MLVQPVTQSKTFKLVVVTQPEAPVQHRRVRVGVRDALVAKLNGGKGTRLANRTYLCCRQRSPERACRVPAQNRHAKRSVSTTKYFSNNNSSTLVPWCVAVATAARVQYHTMETDKRQWTRIQQWVHVHSGERSGQWPRQWHHGQPTRAYLTFLSNLQRFHALNWDAQPNGLQAAPPYPNPNIVDMPRIHGNID